MSTKITIRWGDGFVAISPVIPDKLTTKLRYWHRSLGREEGRMQMVATGQMRELYSISGAINAAQQYIQTLVTMPGFLHRIKTILKEEGYEYEIIDERTPLPAPDFRKAFSGLRDYQCECTYTALRSGGGIIACPTGWGKTHIMGSLINAYSHAELCARNTPTIVVATPEQDITIKDYQDLVEILPDRDIGLVMGGKKRFSDDVQVVTLQSLHLLDLESVGVVIVDEVHTAASEKRSELIMQARKALKFGVSATPDGRFDGRDLVTEGIFGPVVYHRTYLQGITDGALVPIKVLWVKAPAPERVRSHAGTVPMGLEKFMVYKTRTGKYRNGVDRNDTRNALIGDLLNRMPAERQVLCILQHLDHMDKLVYHCPTVCNVHGETAQANLVQHNYTNLVAVSTAERRDTYNKMRDGEIRKIISTYVYKQGVNFPELSVVVNAGGGGSDIVAKQIPGRESRSIDGKSESYLIDFWHDWDMVRDPKTNRMKAGAIHRDDQSREKAYTELGFEQVWLDSVDEIPFIKPREGVCSTT